MAFTSIVTASQEDHRQAGNQHRGLEYDVVADVDGGRADEGGGVDDGRKITPQFVGTGVPVPH